MNCDKKKINRDHILYKMSYIYIYLKLLFLNTVPFTETAVYT